MSPGESSAGKILRDQVEAMSVRDVMYPSPKTLPADTTVGDLRHRFEQPKLRTALLTDGDVFVAVIQRDDLPEAAAPDEPAIAYARSRPETISPESPASDALARIDAADHECRLVVLADDDATLIGLVCMNPARTHFCVGKRTLQA